MAGHQARGNVIDYLLMLFAGLMVLVAVVAHGQTKDLSKMYRLRLQVAHPLGAPDVTLDTIQPIVASISLMVEQTEGPKNKDHDAVNCKPEMPDGTGVLKMTCDNGTKYNVVGINFEGE